MSTSLTAIGQNPSLLTRSFDTEFDSMREIQLTNSSQDEEIYVDITEDTQKLDFLIRSTVSNGKLTIEVYDSNDIKQGNFTIETLTSSDKAELANGRYKKSLYEPQSGKWKVRIIPTDATGTVILQSTIFE